MCFNCVAHLDPHRDNLTSSVMRGPANFTTAHNTITIGLVRLARACGICARYELGDELSQGEAKKNKKCFFSPYGLGPGGPIHRAYTFGARFKCFLAIAISYVIVLALVAVPVGSITYTMVPEISTATRNEL